MKKILFISMIFATALGFTACSGEEDDIFGSTAAERLNAASALYSARLTAQPNGWAMQYYPTYDNEAPNGKGYLILTRFNKDFTANVSGYSWPVWREVSDQQTMGSSSSTEWKCFYDHEYRESTAFWEVITDNGPVLTFNTYNDNMHYFSDPDFRETGTGFGGDYEFIVVEAPDDASYMMLKGKKRGTYNLLTPIEEGVVYEDYMADVTNFSEWIFSEKAPIGCLLTLGDSIYMMDDAQEGLPSIYPLGKDKISYENFNPFLITKRGEDYYLRFRDAFENENLEGDLQDLRYDKEKDMFICTENDQFTITGYPAANFILESIETGHKWQTGKTLENSEKFNVVLDEMIAKLAAATPTYTFGGNSTKEQVVTFFYSEGQLAMNMNLKFKFNKNNVTLTLQYLYNIEADGEKLTIEYDKPLDSPSKNMIDEMPALETFIKSFSGTYNVHGSETNFNLNSVKISDVNDSERWIKLQYFD